MLIKVLLQCFLISLFSRRLLSQNIVQSWITTCPLFPISLFDFRTMMWIYLCSPFHFRTSQLLLGLCNMIGSAVGHNHSFSTLMVVSESKCWSLENSWFINGFSLYIEFLHQMISVLRFTLQCFWHHCYDKGFDSIAISHVHSLQLELCLLDGCGESL